MRIFGIILITQKGIDRQCDNAREVGVHQGYAKGIQKICDSLKNPKATIIIDPPTGIVVNSDGVIIRDVVVVADKLETAISLNQSYRTIIENNNIYGGQW